MKRFFPVSLVIALVISCAAPVGAVFGTDGLDDVQVAEGAIADNKSDEEEAVVDNPAQSLGISENTAVTETIENDAVATDEHPETQPVIPLALHHRQLVISYVQTSGVYGKAIEIRNVSATDYETKQLSLQFVRATDTGGNAPDVLATFYGTIPAGGRVMIGNTTIEQSTMQSADYYFTQSAAAVMSATGGWLLLVDDTQELDSFCWAANTSGICGEDFYPLLPFRDNRAYTRCFEGHVPAPCTSGLPFTPSDRRSVEAGGGYIPFYNQCSGVIVSEVAPQIVDQFIELYNMTDQKISLERCLLQIGTRTYQFPVGTSLEIGEYFVVSLTKLGMSLARTTAGIVRILASNGEVQHSLSYSTPREDRSAILHDGVVVWTLAITPGQKNDYLQYTDCELGYWRNEETGRCNKNNDPIASIDCGEGRERNPTSGRCRNIPAASQLTPCREGQYRSEETNRCRSIATAANALKPCADDQFRNPATNRCKKIASSDDVALADCGEGRERNPSTNRCRNILASTPPTAGFAVEPIQDAANVFIGWWVLGGVTVLALGYAGWEWREEVLRAIRKIPFFGKSRQP